MTVYKLVRFYEPSSQALYMTTRASLTVFSQFLLSPVKRITTQLCVYKPSSLLFCYSAHLSLVFAASPISIGAYSLLKSMVSPTHLYL
jgi:hypothetical protein